MGAENTITIVNFISNISYELRNTDGIQWGKTDELVVYLNKACEILHQVLIRNNSDLVSTGSGSITTVAGTETYDLDSNSMGDLWAVKMISDGDYQYKYYAYITDSSSNVYQPLDICSESERFKFVQAGSSSRTIPAKFYLSEGNIGLLPVPDAVYTLTIAKYYPNFVEPTTNMPYKNIFNLEIGEAIKFMAKNRENDFSAIEAQLMTIFQDRHLEILHLRNPVEKAFTLKGYSF